MSIFNRILAHCLTFIMPTWILSTSRKVAIWKAFSQISSSHSSSTLKNMSSPVSVWTLKQCFLLSRRSLSWDRKVGKIRRHRTHWSKSRILIQVYFRRRQGREQILQRCKTCLSLIKLLPAEQTYILVLDSLLTFRKNNRWFTFKILHIISYTVKLFSALVQSHVVTWKYHTCNDICFGAHQQQLPFETVFVDLSE